MFKSIRVSIVVVAAAFLAITTFTAYGHDPSATTQPGLSHIHVKGRVRSSDGDPIAGARVSGGGTASAILVPTGYINSWSGSTETGSDGRYELIFYLRADANDILNSFTVDKTKIVVTEEGYDIRPGIVGKGKAD